jgi:cytochrome c biogenesis protein CcdA
MYRGFAKGVPFLLLVLVLLLPTASFAEEPIVDVYLLYSETCPHCHIVRTEILPGIEEKYGDKLNIIPLNLSVPDDFQTGLVLEAIYQVPPEQAGVPEIFIGNRVLTGSNTIRDHLDEEIQNLLDAGGFRMPTQQELLDMIVWEEPAGEPTDPITEALKSPIYVPDQILETLEVPSPAPSAADSGAVEMPSPVPNVASLTATSTISPAASPTVTTSVPLTLGAAKPIRMAYFYEVGCNECDRAQYVLNYLQQTDYPGLIIDEFGVVEQTGLAKWLADEYGLAESELLVTPVVFVGDDYLLESEITVNNLVPILNKYEKTGTEATWDRWDAEQGGNAVAGLFQNISLVAVIGAGLIDGINPCAFATIVFFVAYLAFVGRKGRDLVFTGIAFVLGVFIAYLLLGLGLLKVLEVIDITSWGRYFYILVAAACLILAAVNFLDFFKARSGKVEEMQLRLPISFRRQINRVIREGSGVRAFVLVSFATGFVVSVIELACTGQVYIVILSALSHPSLRGQALGYLVIYNLAFVVPLIIVFLLAFLGVESGDLARFVERNTATVKLFTALLFLGLGLWLIYAFLPLFGIQVLGS